MINNSLPYKYISLFFFFQFAGLSHMKVESTTCNQLPVQLEPVVGPITCNRSNYRYDLCSINGPTLLEPNSSTLYAMDPTEQPICLKTRPYPRKMDRIAMAVVSELTLTSAPHNTQCGITHKSPALVFSAGGYTGNFFHEFNENFIPLFITIHSLLYNQDVILVIIDCHDEWSQKYVDLLSHFSRHPIIDIKKETISHCFPSAIVGLISHGPMIVDPTLIPLPKSLEYFRIFLENTFEKDDVSPQLTVSRISNEDIHNSNSTSSTIELLRTSVRPRLVLISRVGNVGRVILNQQEVIKAAEEVGFDVIVFEPTNISLAEAFKIIHPCHAMLGVHGAGLTHLLFLRPGTVLIQVVPIGANWVSDTYFKTPAKELELAYMEYKIKEEESSLAQKYGTNDLVLKDPKSFVSGWSNMMIYLKSQNVKLDMERFKIYLRKAYRKARRFMATDD